ncbi:hypothetical protein [Caldifermentibacillus hisashii]|nr:hypothetical protein [Caldifermentibacillus hisashii]
MIYMRCLNGGLREKPKERKIKEIVYEFDEELFEEISLELLD